MKITRSLSIFAYIVDWCEYFGYMMSVRGSLKDGSLVNLVVVAVAAPIVPPQHLISHVNCMVAVTLFWSISPDAFRMSRVQRISDRIVRPDTSLHRIARTAQ